MTRATVLALSLLLLAPSAWAQSLDETWRRLEQQRMNDDLRAIDRQGMQAEQRGDVTSAEKRALRAERRELDRRRNQAEIAEPKDFPQARDQFDQSRRPTEQKLEEMRLRRDKVKSRRRQ